MTETARADDAGPITASVIPGLGTALAGITMVAMLVPVRRGVDDPVVWAGVAFAAAAAKALPRAEIEIVPGTGHSLNMEKADQVNARMTRFLSERYR